MCVRKSSAQCVLQFAPDIVARYVPHRLAIRVIHRLQLFLPHGTFRMKIYKIFNKMCVCLKKPLVLHS